MKSSLLTLSAALLRAAPTLAQPMPPAQVPAAVQATFQRTFAAAKAAHWEKEGANYEVRFIQAGRPLAAVLTPAGKLLETEAALPLAQLPAAVRASVARAFPTAKVSEAARIVRADGRTVYEAEISQGGKKRDILFTANGQVTK